MPLKKELECKILDLVLHFCFRQLSPVTQMYVSVDASTKESLKKIDRPLFPDFWPRFLDSLRALSEKVQFCVIVIRHTH